MLSAAEKSFFDSLKPSRIVLGLDRVEKVLNRLGNPETRFRSIHIAGTNGKGSTGAFLSSVLSEASYRTGLYSSPHLERFNERISIDGVEISDEEIESFTQEVKKASSRQPSISLTYFEFTTAMAFLYFSRKGVDVAVIETGLGGRLDATNVLTPMVSVITPIDIDHAEYLGDTTSDVAREKGGIIKESVPLVLGRQKEDALAVLEGIAAEKNSQFSLYGRDYELVDMGGGFFRYLGPDIVRDHLSISLIGAHQRENAAVAITVLELLGERGFVIKEGDLKRGLKKAFLPGRFEIITENPHLILDGAHNPAGARIFADAIHDYFNGVKGVVVAGFMGEKDVRGIITELARVSSKLIITRPMEERAFDPEEKMGYIRDMVEKFGIIVIPDIPSAIRKGIEESRGCSFLAVTGSLYLVGEARAFLKGRR